MIKNIITQKKKTLKQKKKKNRKKEFQTCNATRPRIRSLQHFRRRMGSYSNRNCILFYKSLWTWICDIQ